LLEDFLLTTRQELYQDEELLGEAPIPEFGRRVISNPRPHPFSLFTAKYP